MLNVTYRYVTVLVFFAGIFCLPSSSKADHAAGGELYYEWKGGDTYQVYFRFFRDCAGISAPSGLMLCYSNSCNNDWGAPILDPMQKSPFGVDNGAPLSTGCPGYPNRCQSPTSSIPGYQEFWYTKTITLPSKCSEWRFMVAVTARNDNENLQPNANLTLLATVNNLDVSNNSSPVFSVDPVSYVCQNQPHVYNNGAYDRNGDSLVFDVIAPLNGGGCPSVYTNVAFKAGNPAYNTTNNPFQTNNSFTINSRTGQINFTPAMLGAHTVTTRVREYRGNILVGSVIRDLQIRCMNCATPPVALAVDQSSFVNAKLINDEVVGCINQPMTFCYDIRPQGANAILVAKDNHAIFGPAASTNYTGQASNQVRGCFSWTPTTNDIGMKTLNVTVKDSTCTPPGIIVSHTFTIPVRVNTASPPPQVVTPVYLCHNEPAQPLTATGQNLLWYMAAAGGTGSATPITPGTGTLGRTTYYVTQNSNGCESQRVAIEGDVQPNVVSNVSYTDDSVCYFEDITITDNAVNSTPVKYSWDVDAGGIIKSGDSTSQVVAHWRTEGWKNAVITVKNLGCTTKDTARIYVIRTPLADWSLNTNVCLGQVFDLVPVKEPHAKYKWDIDDISMPDTVYKEIYKLTWHSLGRKNISLTLSDSLGCTSTREDSIFVREAPVANITSHNDYLCIGKEFRLYAAEGDRFRYSWTPPQYFTQNGLPEAVGIVERSGYVQLEIINNWNCRATDSIYIYGGPCCEVFMPDAFTPNNDGQNDTYKPVDIESHTLVHFMIVNRQGMVVFETKDPNARWDGKVKGKPQDMGTFSYYLKYICADNSEHTKKGNIILLR